MAVVRDYDAFRERRGMNTFPARWRAVDSLAGTTSTKVRLLLPTAATP